MADPIVVTCPKCKKKMKVPAEAVGKKVRCGGCQTAIPIQAPAAKKPAAPAKAAKPGPSQGISFEEDDGPAVYGLVMPSENEDGEEAPPPPPPPPKPTAPKHKGDDDDDNPYGVTTTRDAPRCPHCAKELESEGAVICLNCGYNTQTRKHSPTRRVLDTTFWDWCVWLAPGIGCVLAIVGLLGFDYWFDIMLQESVWDGWNEGAGTTSFSRGVRLWITAMTAWVIWQAAKFAFRRLILHPRPPEVEIKF